MSYIGRNIDSINNISTLDNLSFNGSDTVFNLTQNSVAFNIVSVDALQIQIDGIIQVGNFTQTGGSQITFDFTPNSGSVCNSVKHFGVGLLTTVSDGAVTEAKIGSGAVTTAKLGADSVNGSKIADDSISDEHLDITAITGQTAITSLADTDKFLVSDASDSGNLKYVENQYLGGGTLVQTAKVFYESSQSTDNVTLVNAFTDDYDHYVMFASLCPSSNTAELRMRFKNQAETQVSGSNYDYASRYFNSDGGLGSSTGSGQDKIVLTESLSNNPTDSPFVGTLWFNINRNHSSTGNMGAFNCHGQYHVVEINNNRRNRAYYHASFYRDSLTNFKAKDIKLYLSSGNFEQANVRMYGIKDSNS